MLYLMKFQVLTRKIKDFKHKEKELNQKYDEIKSKYLDVLLQKRLQTYPELIKITQELGKPKLSYEEHKEASKALKKMGNC